MLSNQSHQSFDNGMNFSSFDTISDDSFFDFHGASADRALPEVEQCNELPSDFVEGVSLADIEQPPKSPGSFFDSAFGSDDTNVSDIHNDMLVWPSDHITQEVQCTQTEIMSSPPISHASEMPNSGLGASPSPIQVSESMGPREQLWRPMVLPTPRPQPKSNSPEVKNTVSKTGPTPGNKPGPKPGTKSKVSKVTKKSTVAQKRTPAIPEQRQRSIQELYNATWDSLSQDEKGRLLLPLLQGINPATGKKVAEASTMLPTPDFEAIGADMITNHPLATSSPAATMTTLSASSPSFNTTEVDYDGIGADYSPPNMDMHPSLTSTCSFTSTNTSVDTDFANMTAATLQEFNRSFDSVDNFGTFSNINSADRFLPKTNRSFGRSLGGPYGNRMTSDPIQIPAPPSVYGCTRQQEALERNAMLRAQGRRR